MLSIAALCLFVLPGPTLEPYAPGENWAGHWGVDVAVAPGAAVAAPLDGVVTFAGEVARVKSVTIRRGAVRISLSHLRTIAVERGEFIRRGDHVGTAGMAHGVPGLHISVRRGEIYVDPGVLTRCGSGGLLRLLPPMLPSLASKD